MSLAGLDAPAVVEAHHASIADSTGWFILKYQDGSRDTIELLKQGVGGVNEARKVVEGYTEKSPLYGLVQYRRRKLILKYVPDGTSRVLQVRLKVQFQAVLDTFTPHDTVFSFTQASELTESALALATMLLPSTGSMTSSNSSLRKRRLNDISEDGDQNAQPAVAEKTKEVGKGEAKPPVVVATPAPMPIPAPVSVPTHTRTATVEPSHFPAPPRKTREEPDELPASALRAKALLAKRKEGESSPPAISPEPPASPPKQQPQSAVPILQPLKESQPLARHAPQLPVPDFGLDKSLPAIPLDSPLSTTAGFEKITEEYVTKNKTEAVPIPEPEPQFDPQPEPEPETEAAPRPSLTAEYLETARYPSGADPSSINLWNDDVAAYAAVKPKKKKLGPRPHVEGTVRPRTSGASDATVRARPVANLPNSVRISNNRAPNTFPLRPSSQQSSKSVPGRFPPSSTHPDVLPPLPSPTHVASFYRPESRPPASRAGSVTTEAAPNATPEKLRLMKALQIRKRNMLQAQRTSASTQASASVSSHAHSASLGSSHTSRGLHPSGSTAKSDANGHLPEPTASLKLWTKSNG